MASRIRDPLLERGPTEELANRRGVEVGRRRSGQRLVEERERVARRPLHLRSRAISSASASAVDAFPGTARRRGSRDESSVDRSVNSKCWVRDRIVGRTFSGFVVASTNTTCVGRLLERLQQRVRGGASSMWTSSTMYTFVPSTRPDARGATLSMRSRIVVDAVVRRRVELEEVGERAGGDRDADLALAARLAVVAEVEAVERLREDARGRGLAGAARAREEVRVADAVRRAPRSQRRGRRAPGRRAPRSAAAGTSGTATGRPSRADRYRPSAGVTLGAGALHGAARRRWRRAPARAGNCGPCTRRRLGRPSALSVAGSAQAALRHTGGPAAEELPRTDSVHENPLRRTRRSLPRAGAYSAAAGPPTGIRPPVRGLGTGHHELPA